MKLTRPILTAMTLIAGIAAVMTLPAYAQQSQLSEAHIQRILENCQAAQRTIQQLHVNDALQRVNRGGVYLSISAKLMAPLNSRFLLNRQDASSLIAITSEYDKTWTNFGSDYKRYNDHVSTVLSIDCKKQPAAFYDAVTIARQYREIVHADVAKLRQLILDYGTAVDKVKSQLVDGPEKEKGAEQ